jgi:Holliday junction resolvase RusA-like endonuclease
VHGLLVVRHMTVTFHVPGKPQGKARPRFGRGHVYTPTETLTAEGNIAWAFQQTGYPKVDVGPVFLDVVVVLDRPRSHFTKAGDLNAAGRANWWCIRKPDGDNSIKLIMDALNGVAYRDDVQVVWHQLYRRWALQGEIGGVIITLSTVAPDILSNVEGMAA